MPVRGNPTMKTGGASSSSLISGCFFKSDSISRRSSSILISSCKVYICVCVCVCVCVKYVKHPYQYIYLYPGVYSNVESLILI